MKPKYRVLGLIAIMAFIVLAIETITIGTLYRTALREELAHLEELVKSEARLIEAIPRFDNLDSKEQPQGARQATIDQIKDAHARYRGFGATGEFTLSKKENDKIVFILSHRHAERNKPKPVPWDSFLAEPMRLALSGRSGSIIGTDYRGAKVLAAYEPVAGLDLGIVAKIDLAEVRAPFVNAALVSAAAAVALIALGVVLFLRVTTPMVRELHDAVEGLQKSLDEQKVTEHILSTAEKMAHIGSWHFDIKKERLIWTEEVYRIFGRDRGEFAPTYESFLESVHPEDRELVDRTYRTAVKEGRPYEVVHRVVRPTGEIRIVRERSENIADASGTIVHSFGMVLDITDAQRYERDRERFISELQRSLSEIKTLRGIIPICAFCKKIRDDKGYWDQVEVYVRQHTEANFSHGICPECVGKHFPGFSGRSEEK